MKVMMVAATVAMLGAGPALAQSYSPDSTQAPPSDDTLDPSLRAEPPGGAYQGYLDSRDIPEQTAELPDEAEQSVHPGTLKKFNSNSGYGPEVEFDQQRRDALTRQQQQAPQR